MILPWDGDLITHNLNSPAVQVLDLHFKSKQRLGERDVSAA
jgi:hypothetical protein